MGHSLFLKSSLNYGGSVGSRNVCVHVQGRRPVVGRSLPEPTSQHLHNPTSRFPLQWWTTTRRRRRLLEDSGPRLRPMQPARAGASPPPTRRVPLLTCTTAARAIAWAMYRLPARSRPASRPSQSVEHHLITVRWVTIFLLASSNKLFQTPITKWISFNGFAQHGLVPNITEYYAFVTWKYCCQGRMQFKRF